MENATFEEVFLGRLTKIPGESKKIIQKNSPNPSLGL